MKLEKVSRIQHYQASTTEGKEIAYVSMYSGKPLKDLRGERQYLISLFKGSLQLLCEEWVGKDIIREYMDQLKDN